MSLKYALLGLLAERPRYGYEIKRRFEGVLGNVWSVSYGQLYPTLHRLSELGWVTKRNEPGKKAAEKTIYSITEKGRRKLDEWLLKPRTESYRVKDESTLRFLFFHKLSTDSVLDYLKGQLSKTAQQRERFEKSLAALPEGIDYFLQAIIRKGIIHLTAEAQWLEEVMEDLRAGGTAARELPAISTPSSARREPAGLSS